METVIREMTALKKMLGNLWNNQTKKKKKIHTVYN